MRDNSTWLNRSGGRKVVEGRICSGMMEIIKRVISLSGIQVQSVPTQYNNKKVITSEIHMGMIRA